MAIIVGPSDWWINTAEAINPLAIACPIGTRLPDGSSLISRAGGCAWIVAPSCTQANTTWNGSTSTLVGDKCCISDWPSLNTLLLQYGFTPSDWLIPSGPILFNPGYTCRTNWDTFSNSFYMSSTEVSATNAINVVFCSGNCTSNGKGNLGQVRAFRCVTY